MKKISLKFESESILKINDAINEVVDGITLADLVSWKMQGKGQYVI